MRTTATLLDGAGQPCQCDVVVAYHADGKVNYLYPYVTYAGNAMADGYTRVREVITAILAQRAEIHADAVPAFMAGCGNDDSAAVNAIRYLVKRLHSHARNAMMAEADSSSDRRDGGVG